jgi:hypothetical protein
MESVNPQLLAMGRRFVIEISRHQKDVVPENPVGYLFRIDPAIDKNAAGFAVRRLRKAHNNSRCYT